MDATTLVLALVAAILLAIAFSRGRSLPVAAVRAAGRTLWTNLPIVLLGFLIAGLVQVLVPKEWITQWLGGAAGFRGVLLGCLAGGLVPGSPYAVYPVVAGLYKAGASLGAVVAFVTAWSLWSVSRLPVEVALIDPRVAALRYAITFLVPPLAGLAANVLGRLVV
jgi:uncharacterized membrane protein YraQ (UPF0718 family)